MTDQRLLSLFESVTSAQPMDMPVKPPELVRFEDFRYTDKYKELSREAKNKMERDLFEQDFMQEYIESKWKAQLNNRDAVLWLCQYRDVEKPNEEQEHALTVKLKMFLDKIGNQAGVYESLKLDFSKLKLLNY